MSRGFGRTSGQFDRTADELAEQISGGTERTVDRTETRYRWTSLDKQRSEWNKLREVRIKRKVRLADSKIGGRAIAGKVGQPEGRMGQMTGVMGQMTCM